MKKLFDVFKLKKSKIVEELTKEFDKKVDAYEKDEVKISKKINVSYVKNR